MYNKRERKSKMEKTDKGVYMKEIRETEGDSERW